VKDVEELFRQRISEAQVAQVLQLIGALPNKRDRPTAGDLPGRFDFWFDGGAGQIVTGYNQYDFADGTRAIVVTSPVLEITLQFPNGSRVGIQQEHS